MSYEQISVEADGALYEGWTNATVIAHYAGPYRAFDLQVSEVGMDRISPFERWPLPPGIEVKLYTFGLTTKVPSTGDLLVSGYVNEYKPEVDASGAAPTAISLGKISDTPVFGALRSTGNHPTPAPDTSCHRPEAIGTNATSD